MGLPQPGLPQGCPKLAPGLPSPTNPAFLLPFSFGGLRGPRTTEQGGGWVGARRPLWEDQENDEEDAILQRTPSGECWGGVGCQCCCICRLRERMASNEISLCPREPLRLGLNSTSLFLLLRQLSDLRRRSRIEYFLICVMGTRARSSWLAQTGRCPLHLSN